MGRLRHVPPPPQQVCEGHLARASAPKSSLQRAPEPRCGPWRRDSLGIAVGTAAASGPAPLARPGRPSSLPHGSLVRHTKNSQAESAVSHRYWSRIKARSSKSLSISCRYSPGSPSHQLFESRKHLASSPSSSHVFLASSLVTEPSKFFSCLPMSSQSTRSSHATSTPLASSCPRRGHQLAVDASQQRQQHLDVPRAALILHRHELLQLPLAVPAAGEHQRPLVGRRSHRQPHVGEPGAARPQLRHARGRRVRDAGTSAVRRGLEIALPGLLRGATGLGRSPFATDFVEAPLRMELRKGQIWSRVSDSHTSNLGGLKRPP